MSTVDFVILVLLGGFVLSGLWFGLIHMIGSIVGLFAGAFVASRFYEPAAQVLVPFLGGNLNLARLVGFFLVFVLATRLCGLGFWLLEKAYNFFAVIPGMKLMNRFLGAIFGLIEGTFVIGLAVFFASRFPYSEAFTTALQGSALARPVLAVGSLLAPLLPAALKAAQTVL
ncbi:hypothetical protein A3C96_03830 [Candidatus Uhrbacteria bacterium RIFCSPHIGHO2_02_FULL_60_10]|uniref:Colicin V production protein n=1 Tax=Candidatus Uhrbacteria bacterium RIFCSPHIGHO2_02_FULL_60_10 TaxID=1802392 RepID=A0A1F7U6A2_9BACT|nr:MAG: hypothetical protein A3C96_03830 [Candidatus Uhrbacteria bacterium RIFCSPHIGHO2_02_FULL_60_10]